MKIWLPNSLYRLKPLLLLLVGVYLLFLYDNMLASAIAFLCFGYAIWILASRLMWSNSGMLKTRVGADLVGEQGGRVVNVSEKKLNK